MQNFKLNLVAAIVLTTSGFTFAQQVAEQPPAAASSIDDVQRSVWEALRTGHPKLAATLGERLAQTDPANPLACAGLLADPAVRTPQEVISIGRRGLRAVGSLQPLKGMAEPEFAEMSKRVRTLLNQAVGQAYLALNDEVTARRYLKEVVALNPNSARDAYIAGQAFLNGKNPDPTVGYWLMARTVVLAHGTEAGDKIGQYAYQRYMAAGGREEHWKGFLAGAATGAPPVGTELASSQPAGSEAPAPSQAPAATSAASTSVETPPQSNTEAAQVANAAPPADRNTKSAGNSSIASPPSTTASAAVTSQRPTGTDIASATPAPPSSTSSDSSVKRPTEPSPPATVSPAVSPPARAAVDNADLARIRDSLPQADQHPPEAPREVATNIPPAAIPTPPTGTVRQPTPREPLPKHRLGEPLSVGVLIQAKIASPENRRAVIYALSDMLRRLRDDDEAFIVSYGEGIGFEQDLTWNYDMLEKAMDRIKPERGADLLDAVAFSAGHLARVAKNPNRVLIVISDGENDIAGTSSLAVASELRGSAARVYCIGLGVAAPIERNRLQELANMTGGGTSFVAQSNDVRHAVHQIAANLGIDFQE